MTGYDRELFGYRAFDTDSNGCDTRNDILARDLTGTTTDPDTGGCVVLSGALNDPYTGQTLTFDRAKSTIDIDRIESVPATPSSA